MYTEQRAALTLWPIGFLEEHHRTTNEQVE